MPQTGAVVKPMDEISANEFTTLLETFSSSQVTIHVGTEPDQKKYTLPKALLCRQSEFFREMFEGEATPEAQMETHLLDVSTSAFELVIQYIFLGKAILPENIQGDGRKSITSKLSNDIDQWLGFITLCHKLRLHKQCDDDIVAKIEACVVEERSNLPTSEQIDTAMQLPVGHSLRVLFAQAWVREYMQAAYGLEVNGSPITFTYEKKVRKSVAFMADMKAAMADAMMSIQPEIVKKGHARIVAQDPLSEEFFHLTPAQAA